jgi:uncharacterized protein YlxW (UPF0749 family)
LETSSRRLAVASDASEIVLPTSPPHLKNSGFKTSILGAKFAQEEAMAESQSHHHPVYDQRIKAIEEQVKNLQQQVRELQHKMETHDHPHTHSH